MNEKILTYIRDNPGDKERLIRRYWKMTGRMDEHDVEDAWDRALLSAAKTDDISAYIHHRFRLRLINGWNTAKRRHKSLEEATAEALPAPELRIPDLPDLSRLEPEARAQLLGHFGINGAPRVKCHAYNAKILQTLRELRCG